MWHLWLVEMSLQHIQKNSPSLLPKPAKFEKNPPNGYRVIRKTKCGAGGARSSPIHKQASLAGRLITEYTTTALPYNYTNWIHYHCTAYNYTDWIHYHCIALQLHWLNTLPLLCLTTTLTEHTTTALPYNYTNWTHYHCIALQLHWLNTLPLHCLTTTLTEYITTALPYNYTNWTHYHCIALQLH